MVRVKNINVFFFFLIQSCFINYKSSKKIIKTFYLSIFPFFGKFIMLPPWSFVIYMHRLTASLAMGDYIRQYAVVDTFGNFIVIQLTKDFLSSYTCRYFARPRNPSVVFR